MKENKKNPFVVFENNKINQKQQEFIRKLLVKQSDVKIEKIGLLSEEMPCFTMMRTVFYENSKEVDKIFSIEKERGEFNFVLEGLKKTPFGVNDGECFQNVEKLISSIYYTDRYKIFEELGKSFCFSGVFAEYSMVVPSILMAGVVNGNKKNIHLYYGYMGENLVLSNEESIIKVLCEEIREIEENTYLWYEFGSKTLVVDKPIVIKQKKYKQKKKQKLKSIQKELEFLKEKMATLEEQMKLIKRLEDDGK